MEAKFSPELNALINAAQHKNELRKGAAMMFQLYSELVSAGFSEGQALYIVTQSVVGGKTND